MSVAPATTHERLIGEQFTFVALTEAVLDDPHAISDHRDSFEAATARMETPTYTGVCNALNRLLVELPRTLAKMPGTTENDPNGRALLFRHAPATTVEAAGILQLLRDNVDPAILAHELVETFFLKTRTGAPFEAAVALMRMNLDRHASAPTPDWKRWHVLAQIMANVRDDVVSAGPDTGGAGDDDTR